MGLQAAVLRVARQTAVAVLASRTGGTRRWPVLLPMLATLALGTACAPTPVQVVELPEREADLYPTADTRQGVTVAVDEIRDGNRSKRYFGVDFPERNILPVQIIVSNRGAGRISVRPEDVLLLQGRQVRDPMPARDAAAFVAPGGFGARAERAEEVQRFFEEISLRERILPPGESYRAVLFFEMERERRETRREAFWRRHEEYLRLTRLFADPRLQLHLVLTELEHGDRLRFGPFGVGS